MPKNNFKLFDENKSNMMTDVEYNTNAQRLNGVQSGVASSQLQNKTLYQTALMCYALAQLMAANGYDANDADAVSTFVNNMSSTMVQKVVDKASAKDITDKIAGKWVDAKQIGELEANIEDNYLPLLGGTMLGDLILNIDPISSMQAATKKYVDDNDIKLEIKTRVGDGTTSRTQSGRASVSFSFVPKLVIIVTECPKNMPNADGQSVGGWAGGFWPIVYVSGLQFNGFNGFQSSTNNEFSIGTEFIVSGTTLTLKYITNRVSTNAEVLNNAECNVSGVTYYWIAFG